MSVETGDGRPRAVPGHVHPPHRWLDRRALFGVGGAALVGGTVAAVHYGTQPGVSSTGTDSTAVGGATKVAHPSARKWLSGYFGSGDAATRAAWAAEYFRTQVWTSFVATGTSFSRDGVASVAYNGSQYSKPVSDGSSINVVSIPLLAAPTQAINPTALRAAAGGSDVSGWTALAHAIRAQGLNSPSTVLRIGWEPNTPSYPWSTEGDPAALRAYRQAWRHAHDAVHAVCPRVRFCLCLNNRYGGRAAISGHYPGDAYVDILGLDFYDFSHSRTQASYLAALGSCGFTDIGAFAHAHGKQFSLNEWGVDGDAPASVRDNPFFIRAVYNSLVGLDRRYPGIVSHDSYFNHSGGYNLRANPAASATYRSLWTTRPLRSAS